MHKDKELPTIPSGSGLRLNYERGGDGRVMGVWNRPGQGKTGLAL